MPSTASGARSASPTSSAPGRRRRHADDVHPLAARSGRPVRDGLENYLRRLDAVLAGGSLGEQEAHDQRKIALVEGGPELRSERRIFHPDDRDVAAQAAAGWDRCFARLEALRRGGPLGEPGSLAPWPYVHERYADEFGVDPEIGRQAYHEHPAT